MSDDQNRRSAEKLFYKGLEAFDEKAFEKAIAFFTQAIELKPDYADAYNNRGGAKAKLKDTQGAIEDFTTAIQLKPDFVEAYYNRGLAKDDLKNHQGAIEDYTKAIELKPDYAVAYNNRGVAKAELKDYEGAIEDYTEAIKLNRNDEKAYCNRGIAKSNLENYQGAKEDLIEAIKLKSDYAKAHCNLGAVKAKLEDHHGAIEDYTEAIHLKSDYVEAYFSRGLSKAKLEDYEGAIEDYTQAIKLKSDYWEAYNNRGSAKYDLKDYPGAIDDFSKAMKLNPKCADAYFNRGLAYLMIGQEEEADEDFKKAQRLDPTIVFKEQIKKDKDLKSIGKDVKEAKEFEVVLRDLEKKFFKKKENTLWLISLVLIIVTALTILAFIVPEIASCLRSLISFCFSWLPCLSEQSSCCTSCCSTDQEMTQYDFWRVSSLIGFMVAITFYMLSQYNKVANLRIDARNRLAMAKLLYKVERDIKETKGDSDERKLLYKTYAKLMDCIAYRIEFKNLKQSNDSVIDTVMDQISKLKK